MACAHILMSPWHGVCKCACLFLISRANMFLNVSSHVARACAHARIMRLHIVQTCAQGAHVHIVARTHVYKQKHSYYAATHSRTCTKYKCTQKKFPLFFLHIKQSGGCIYSYNCKTCEACNISKKQCLANKTGTSSNARMHAHSNMHCRYTQIHLQIEQASFLISMN